MSDIETVEDFAAAHDRLLFTFDGQVERKIREVARSVVESERKSQMIVIPFTRSRYTPGSGFLDVRVVLPLGVQDFEAQLLVEKQIRRQLGREDVI